MTIFAKLFSTWITSFLLIMIYGFWEIDLPDDPKIRDKALNIWLVGVFVFGVIFIWRI